jgi:hypothetical protein
VVQGEVDKLLGANVVGRHQHGARDGRRGH